MAWTDDRVEILKKLWAEGLSASQIARELGDVTRNAVITHCVSSVHFLGEPPEKRDGQPAFTNKPPREHLAQSPAALPTPGSAGSGSKG